MATQKYDRFKAAPWFQEGIKPAVLVGGAGGIGSWLTLLLNRAGFETYVFDFDRLEELNMAGQLFMHKSIGKPKVEALADLVRELCREEIVPNNERLDEHSMTNNIVFSAFDNMLARKHMFQVWKAANFGNADAIFIDGRLTMEQLTIFSVRANNAEELTEYEQVHLFDDSQVEEMSCTAKQTSHGAAMIASHMVAKFTNFYSGVVDKDEERDTVFYWQHFIPANYTFQRPANAIQEAKVAMQEDEIPDLTEEQLQKITEQLHETGHAVISLDELTAPDLLNELLTNSKDITPDLPGIGDHTFEVQLNQDQFGVIQPQGSLNSEEEGQSESTLEENLTFRRRYTRRDRQPDAVDQFLEDYARRAREETEEEQRQLEEDTEETQEIFEEEVEEELDEAPDPDTVSGDTSIVGSLNTTQDGSVEFVPNTSGNIIVHQPPEPEDQGLTASDIL
jgi:hypothetical protein